LIPFRIVRLSAAALLAALSSFALPGGTWAIDAAGFAKSTGDKSYNDGLGHSMPYRLFLPDGYNTPGTNYPLVLFMHGAGERGTNNTSQCNSHVDNLFAATQGSFGTQYKAFLLAPQVPATSQWVDWNWSSGSYTNAQEPAESQSMKLALAILDQVLADYPVDARRIYVTGLSMGGYGTWDAVRRHPDKFAAAAPLSGGGNKEQGPLLKDIPIWAYHGSADGTVPVLATDNMNTAIATAGGFMEYTRPAVGHGGWGTFYDNTTYRNSQNQTFDQWLFAQSLPVPEPSTWALLVSGGGLLTWEWRRRNRAE
jgi:predicted peptidase